MAGKLFEFSPYIVAFLLYPILASFVLRTPSESRWRLLAALNILASFVVVLALYSAHLYFVPIGTFIGYLVHTAAAFGLYVGFTLICRLAMIRSIDINGPIVVLAYLLPVSMLPVFLHGANHRLVIELVGVSYLSLRLCQLVSEVRNGTVVPPSTARYLAFAFHVPIIFVGPITPYETFQDSVERFSGRSISSRIAVLRMVVGAVKFFFLSAVLGGITYGAAFLSDGNQHSWLDLALAVLVYPLYLYCNFSGLCDLAIGASALCGISVMENFDRPFSARNFQEFWSRWHISLSKFMRDLVFTPTVKALTRRMSAAALPAATAIGILTVFLLIGAWHGLKPNFILFGISQGFGVLFIFLGGRFLKWRLSKAAYVAYMRHPGWRVVGIAATYLYFSLTMFLFANSFEDARAVLAHLR